MKHRPLFGIGELFVHGPKPPGDQPHQPAHEFDTAFRTRVEEGREFVCRDPPDEAFTAGDDSGAGSGGIEHVHLANRITGSQCRDQERSPARLGGDVQHSRQDEVQIDLGFSLRDDGFAIYRADEFSERGEKLTVGRVHFR